MLKPGNKKQFGLSLMELIIMIGIIATITVYVTVRFKSVEYAKRVGLAADTVVNAFKIAQNNALSGKQLSESTCTISGVSDKAPAFYTVMFFTAYTDRVLVLGTDKCNNAYTIETLMFPIATRIKEVDPITVCAGAPSALGDCAGGTLSTMTALGIRLTPPFARLAADTGTVNPFTYATVTVTDTDGNNPKTVRFDGVSGRVIIE
jgi:hypothetical protein